jgi:hypothetical protein
MDIGIRNLFEIENKVELFWEVEITIKYYAKRNLM